MTRNLICVALASLLSAPAWGYDIESIARGLGDPKDYGVAHGHVPTKQRVPAGKTLGLVLKHLPAHLETEVKAAIGEALGAAERAMRDSQAPTGHHQRIVTAAAMRTGHGAVTAEITLASGHTITAAVEKKGQTKARRVELWGMGWKKVAEAPKVLGLTVAGPSPGAKQRGRWTFSAEVFRQNKRTQTERRLKARASQRLAAARQRLRGAR